MPPTLLQVFAGDLGLAVVQHDLVPLGLFHFLAAVAGLPVARGGQFTHICATKRANGRFTVKRLTIAKRMCASLKALRQTLKRRKHEPIPVIGRWLRRVVQGYFNDHAVPGNTVWQHTSTRTFKQPPPAAMPSAPGVSGEWRSEVLRISAIVDAQISLIVDAVSA